MSRVSHYCRRLVAVLAIVAAIASPALGRERKHHRHPRVVARVMPLPATPADASPNQPPLDDLYRRRGYGVGGAIFGGDTALAGNCADLRFAQPASCGRGYGIYGNGLGSQFGH